MAAGKKSGGGSRKGVPNKATGDVRAAFALLLKRRADLFDAWIMAVAEGEKEPRVEDGKPVLDEQGEPIMKWLRRPDPGYAVTLALNVAEYHIPKLARTEINGEIGVRGKLIISD